MKKKLLIILLIPLLVLITACSNEETKRPTPDDRNVSFKDTELQEYVDYINPMSIGPSADLYNVDKVKARELTTAEKLKYIGNNQKKKKKHSADAQYSILKETDVKEVMEKIYGPNTYEQTSFSLGCGEYELRNDGSYYAQTGCGGATTTSVYNVIVDYKATTTRLEITTAYVFTDGMTNKIYKDYDKTIELDNYTENQNMKEYIKNNRSKLNRIVYTFESKDGKNYYFRDLRNKKK